MVLALASAFAWLTTGWLFAAVFVVGAAHAMELPTLHALMPQLVPTALIPRAAAASASSNQTASILGPALGGLAYAAQPALVYALCSAAFLVASVLVAPIRVAVPPPAREKFGLASLFLPHRFHSRKAGRHGRDLARSFRRAARRRHRAPADVRTRHPHDRTWGLGLLRSAPAVGALSAALLLSHRPLGGGVGRIMLAAVIGFRCHHCLCTLDVVPAVARRTRGARCCQLRQRRHPFLARSDRMPCAAA